LQTGSNRASDLLIAHVDVVVSGRLLVQPQQLAFGIGQQRELFASSMILVLKPLR
jgi:hypothetical protein